MSNTSNTSNTSNFVSNKNMFNLLGFSMLPILLEEINFSDLGLCVFDNSDLTEKWQHPLIIDMRDKLREKYGLFIRKINANLCKQNTKIEDIVNANIVDTGISLVNIGGKSILHIQEEERVLDHILEDGDMVFFDMNFLLNNSISIEKKDKMSVILTFIC